MQETPKLNARQRRYLRKQVRQPMTSAAELDGELNIVPYLDVVVNLIMFLLMVISSAAFFTRIDVRLAAVTPAVGVAGKGTDLHVMLAERGFIVSDAEGVLAGDCTTTRGDSDAITIPRDHAGFDFASLTTCARAVERRHPGASGVTFSADPRIPYQDLLSAMDAVRADEDGPLFSAVQLAAGVR